MEIEHVLVDRSPIGGPALRRILEALQRGARPNIKLDDNRNNPGFASIAGPRFLGYVLSVTVARFQKPALTKHPALLTVMLSGSLCGLFPQNFEFSFPLNLFWSFDGLKDDQA